ncbi:MAG: hypothetical protein HUK01_01400 [Bacteroidaceae bacterium]|nr:hypothetical protein [Bacteroidaceae bacterium]
MKKTYLSPVADVVNIRLAQIVAESIRQSETEVEYGDVWVREQEGVTTPGILDREDW